MTQPKQYKARTLDGKWVHGWFAVLHQTVTDNHDKVVRIKQHPALFNDKPGDCHDRGYWQIIDINTLEEWEEK